MCYSNSPGRSSKSKLRGKKARPGKWEKRREEQESPGKRPKGDNK